MIGTKHKVSTREELMKMAYCPHYSETFQMGSGIVLFSRCQSMRGVGNDPDSTSMSLRENGAKASAGSVSSQDVDQ